MNNIKYNTGENIFNSYYVKDYIGEGRSGRVYLVKNKIGLTSAIRVLKNNIKINKKNIEAIIRFRSNRFITIEDFGITKNDEDCVLMEYAEKNLTKLLETPPIEEQKACRYFIGILKGLKIIHDANFVHGNIKPSKLFFSNMLRINDLGLYDYIDSNIFIIDNTYDLYFKPPEYIENKPGISTDLWAASTLFYYMLSGKFPFYGDTQEDIIDACFNHEPDLNIVPSLFRPYLEKCFQKKLEKRYLSAKQMINDFIDISKNIIQTKKGKSKNERFKKRRSGCIACI